MGVALLDCLDSVRSLDIMAAKEVMNYNRFD